MSLSRPAGRQSSISHCWPPTCSEMPACCMSTDYLMQERGPQNKTHMPPTAVGVTNPYFLRAFENCPNVMTITHEPSALTPASDSDDAQQIANVQPGMLSTLFTASGSFHPDLLAGKLDSLALQRGLLCTGQDRAVLLKIKAASDAPSATTVLAACHMMRIHFHHLTASFLLPFYDFLEQPCPWAPSRKAAATSPSQPADGFNVKIFQEFLEGYPISDAVLSIAGNRRKAHALYQAFTDSVNFRRWVPRIAQG
eukprot:jgi/Ulvmu1/5396/UM022_0191.1